MENRSQKLAEGGRRDFCGVKAKQFAKVRADQQTMNGVVAVLRKKYEKLTSEYLRAEGTTYGDWLEHGPKGEWEEVLEATRDSSVWDRLVDTFEKREVA